MSAKILDYIITLHQVHLFKMTKHWDSFVSHCIYPLTKMTTKGQVLGANLHHAMHEGCSCWPSCCHVTMVPFVIPICTHNPPYEQWLVGMGVGVVPFIIIKEHDH